MPDPEISILIRAKDEAGRTLGDVQGRLEGMSKQLRMAGVAMAAVGVAGLKLVADSKKLNAQLGVTALGLGITVDELRNLTLETANVTFPINEVAASFDLLTRAGIRNIEILQSTATAFDTLGDAIDMPASAVTDIMVPAMKTFRLSAEEIADKTDMMTYMVRNSTTSLEDFAVMVGYTSQDMVAAGLTIDDMAAAMMYMSDNGVEPGKVMLREWNKAVTQSEKEGIALTEALGMTSAELEIYKGKLEGATGMTQEYADIANEQYGIIDKLKHGFSELTAQLGSQLEPLEGVFAAMTALSPVMIFLSTQAGISTVRWVAHAVATTAAKVGLAGLNIALGTTIALVAGLTAGIGLLIYGLYQLNQYQQMQNALEEKHIEMMEERSKLLRGEVNRYNEITMEYIKMREAAGSLNDAEQEWIETTKASLKEQGLWIEEGQLSTEVMKEMEAAMAELGLAVDSTTGSVGGLTLEMIRSRGVAEDTIASYIRLFGAAQAAGMMVRYGTQPGQFTAEQVAEMAEFSAFFGGIFPGGSRAMWESMYIGKPYPLGVPAGEGVIGAGMEYGGVVPGMPGQPMPIIAHGGELFLGRGGVQLHQTLHIYLDGREVEKSVVERITEDVHLQGA